MTTPIKFYILETSTASDTDAVLNFVCKLTRTVLKRSQNSLVIVDDNPDRLRQLDDLLWAFEPTAFIPHEMFIANQLNSALQLPKAATDFVSNENKAHNNEVQNNEVQNSQVQNNEVQNKQALDNDNQMNEAQNDTRKTSTEASHVTDGIFDNADNNKSKGEDNDNAITLADLSAPVTLVSQLPEGFDGVVLNLTGHPIKLGSVDRVLEIISQDAQSAERGRQKVHYYRGFDSEITYHPIKFPL